MCEQQPLQHICSSIVHLPAVYVPDSMTNRRILLVYGISLLRSSCIVVYWHQIETKELAQQITVSVYCFQKAKIGFPFVASFTHEVCIAAD